MWWLDAHVLPRRRAGDGDGDSSSGDAGGGVGTPAWTMGADGTRGAGLSPNMASALKLQPKTMHLVEHLLAQGPRQTTQNAAPCWQKFAVS